MATVGTAYLDIKPDFSGLNREVAARVGPLANQWGSQFGKALGPVMKQQAKHFRTFATAAKYGAAGGAALAVVVGKDIVNAGMKFEKQMSANAAVSEANRKQLAALERQSIKLGKATFYSASEAAEAQGELIKGGLKIKQVLGGGLPAALALAESGQLELATAAETTVNAMKLFDLQGKDSMSVADMLSTAANRTTADVLDFAMAMKQGGSVTNLAGYDMNETVTVLEALAEAGIKNSDAGTSMKTAMIQLLKPTEKQAKMTRLLGIHWTDQTGQMKDAAGLSKELRVATEGMTKAERAKTFATLAGTDGVRTLNALYSETPKELRELEKANARQGTAQEIAAKKMDNLAGEVEQFKGSLETAEIQIYKGMAPALKELAHEGTEAANRIGSVFDNEHLSGSEKVGRAVEVLQDELGKIWDQHEMSAHLEDALEFAVNTAVPKMAEHAGELGFEAAKGFARGFTHADFIGKIVMGTWLLNFIGGKAPFIAIGKTMGRTLGINLAEETAKTAGPLIAVETVAATRAATVASAAPMWSPAAPALGAGAARKAAADATSRALLQESFGAFTLASPAAQKALSESGKLGASAYVKGFVADARARLPQMKATAAEMAGRFGRGLTTYGLGGLVVGEMSKEIVGGDTGQKLATAFQSAGVGAAIGGAITPGIGTAIGAVLAGTGGLLIEELGGGGDHLGDQYAEEFISAFEKKLPGLKKALTRMEFGQPGRSAKQVFSVGGTNFPMPKHVDGSGLRGARAELREQLGVLRETDASAKALAVVRQKLLLVNTAIRQGVKDVHTYKSGFDLLRSGTVVRMDDIQTVMQRDMAHINRVWADNPAKWRQATAENMQAVIGAIKHGMKTGAISTDAGLKKIKGLLHKANLLEGKDPLHIAKGFRSDWRKAGDVTDKSIGQIKHDLGLMPQHSQEAAQNTMIRMARGMEKAGALPKGAADRLRSALVVKFGKTGRETMRHFERQAVTGAKQGLKGILRVFAGNDPLMISKAFARSWDKSNGINKKQIQRAVKVLHELHGPARDAAKQAMTAMADEMQRNGKIKQGAENLRSALDAAFGKSAPQHIHGLKNALAELNTSSDKTFGTLTRGPKRYTEGLGKASTAQGSFQRSAVRATGTAGTAWGDFADLFKSHSAQPFKADVASMNEAATTKMTGVIELANTILKGLGVNAVDYGSGKEQKKQSGGFIVPGSGSGDTFKTWGEVGAFVMNREATAAYGFRDGGPVPLALEPGERYFTQPEVQKVGRPTLEAMNASVPRFGFQKGGGIGPEPKLLGPSGGLRDLGEAAIAKVYAGAKHYLDKHSGGLGAIGAHGSVADHPELQPAISAIVATILRRWPGLAITSTTGGGHAEGSYHYSGRAADLAAGIGYMLDAAAWIKKKLGAELTEGIHNPNLSVKYGKEVSPAFWGSAVWADHLDHIHVAKQLGGLIQALASGGRLRDPGEFGKHFQDRAQKIWAAAAPFYGHPGHAMPRTWATNGGSGGRSHTAAYEDGTRAVYLARATAKEVLEEIPSGEETLIHEWAHIFQPEINKRLRDGHSWEVEGGAEAFARWAAPQIYKDAGFYYGSPGPMGYPGRVAKVIKEKGWNWIMHGQFLRNGGLVQALSTGGPVPPSNGELVGASYYGGPTDHVSGTVGAAGVSLPGKMSFAELAMGKALGGLPFHTKLKIGYNGKSVIAEKLDIGLGGDSVNGHNRAIDLWYETANAIGMPGLAVVKVSPTDGSKVNSTEHSSKEDVPAVYHGAKTGGLHFPPVPKSLKEVEKEIGRWQGEAGVYRKAKKAAEKANRPGVAQAIGKNLTAIENHLRQMRGARHKLRLEAAKKAVTRALGKKLGKITGYETQIEGLQRSFNEASQDAEQLVSLEPQSPELPASASDSEREAAEKSYVQKFGDYVNNLERPAYQDLLGKAADWRNAILRAEYFGFGEGKPGVATMEGTWEKKIRGIDGEIDHIETFSEKVRKDIATYKKNNPKASESDFPKWLKDEISKRDKLREKLPFLKFEDREFRKTLGEGRTFFYPGGKNRISPPTPPLEGTGSLEEKLSEVQGLHWPDQHSLLPASALAPPRVAGKFGGAIWDLQETIEGLGLKITQAQNSLGGASGSEGDSEQAQLLRELLTQANQEKIVRAIEEQVMGQGLRLGGEVLPPYAGKAHTGAIVPGPRSQERTMIVKGREGIFTEEQMAALGPVSGSATQLGPLVVNVYEDGTADAQLGDQQIEAVVNRMDRRQARGAGRRRAGVRGF